MSEMLVKLVPDDEPPTEMALDLEPEGEAGEAGYPYDLAGAMAGLLVFLVGRGLAPEWHPVSMLGIAVVTVFAVTLWLEARRIRLPRMPLAVAAAELGMLYSLPASLVYHQAWQVTTRGGLLALLLLAFLVSATALLAVIAAAVFDREHRAYLLLGFCFLGAFVLTNLGTVLAVRAMLGRGL